VLFRSLVLRFEATAEDALDLYQREVMDWLAKQGVRTGKREK